MAIVNAEWRKYAACRGMDTSLFFPEPGVNGQVVYAQEAKDACASCAVRDACYKEAKHNWERGFWGGTTSFARGLSGSRRLKAKN